ncbi:MAG: diguanylate cyclase [Clostridia bacterium]
MMQDKYFIEMLELLYEGIYFVDNDRTITAWNKGAEKITGFQAKDVVMRKCFDNTLNHVDECGNQLCLNGCPLHATIQDGIPREARVYLHHAKGHRVPVLIKTMPMYDENEKIIGAVEIFIDDGNKIQILNKLEQYRKEASEDALTGISNRRSLELALSAKMEEFKTFQIPFAVAFIDIDDFKKVNDKYGHEVGDQVLKVVAKTIDESERKHDMIGRWGGEEFLAVLTNVGPEDVAHVSERMRFLVERSVIRSESQEVSVTISIGVTEVQQGDTVDSIVQRADKLMYQSKLQGKNRVTIG